MAAASGVLLLSLVTIGLLAGLGLAAFLLGRRSRVKSVKMPCCARCLYPVQGLASLSCPECGSDLRDVGILTPAMRRPLAPWLAILLWTLALPIPALILTGVVSTILPSQFTSQKDWMLIPGQPSAIDQINVQVSSRDVQWFENLGGSGGQAWNDDADEVVLSLVRSTNAPAAPDARLVLDLEHKTWSLSSTSDTHPLDTLDEAALIAWLGVAPGEDGDGLVQPLTSLLDTMRDAPLGRQGLSTWMNGPATQAGMITQQGGSMSVVGPVRGALIGWLVLWILLWLLGCIHFYRRPSAAH